MFKPKVSIIIPVYNLASYLSKCLESVLNQDFDDYELILINDGSTDNSGEICNLYGLKDRRIQVFHQINKGVSLARNLGLEKARAEWICFVDGDDQLYPKSLALIMEVSCKSNSDMVIARSFTIKKGHIGNERYKFDESFLDNSFDGYQLMTEKVYKRGSVCGCIYKTDFLRKHKIYFPVGLTNGEDSIFISLVNLYIQHVSFVDQIFYLVNEREGSASRNWFFDKVNKMTDSISFIYEYINKHPYLSRKQISILHYEIYRCVSSIFYNFSFCFSITNYFKLLKSVNNLLVEKIDTGDIPLSKGKVRLLNMSLKWFSIFSLINQVIRKSTK